MSRKYFFLGGMYRSGNTLLSAIMNQNPDFYVSPLSPVVEYLWRIYDCKNQFETALVNPNTNRTDMVLSEILNNYYYDVDKKYIVDRNKAWIHDPNINMIKEHVEPRPKILFTVRPLRECVASLMRIDYDNQVRNMMMSDFHYDSNLSKNDNLAEFILSGNMGLSLRYAFSSYLENQESNIHIIKYSDLISDPQKTMNLIYDFLEVDKYYHNFDNIVRHEKENDQKLNMSKDLHVIRKKIEHSDLIVEDYLSNDMIEKCNSLDLFDL